MHRKPFYFLILTAFLVSSCKNNEIGNSDDVNPETIFFDYQVKGEEGNENVTVLLQFRFAGENGTTLTLNEPATVQLDGEKIIGDSSKLTGAFYEIQKPVSNFSGRHSIVFINADKKQYKEDFSFHPFYLKSPVPSTVQRGDLEFELEGLEPEDYISVLLTDTSYTGDGINRVDTVRNGKLIITRQELQNLSSGPIQMQLIKEIDKPVKNGTKEGGRLQISYGLKREFFLID
ncbi:MAG: hypothetical protein WBC06_07755 [Chitinophagaceae bacterium]